MMATYLPDREVADSLNRNGVRWNEAPAPPVDHRCHAQTVSSSRDAVGAWVPVSRCPCGATRVPGGGWRPAAVPRVGRQTAAGQLSRAPSNALLWLALGAILAALAMAATVFVVAGPWMR